MSHNNDYNDIITTLVLCRNRRVHAEYELNDFNSNLPKRWAPFCVQVGLLDLGGFKGLELLVIKC